MKLYGKSLEIVEKFYYLGDGTGARVGAVRRFSTIDSK